MQVILKLHMISPLGIGFIVKTNRLLLHFAHCCFGLIHLLNSLSASGAATATFVNENSVPETKRNFGSPANGLSLGLSLMLDTSGSTTSIVAYAHLKNTGSNAVFINHGGPDSLFLSAATESGSLSIFGDKPEVRIGIRNNFVSGNSHVMAPGATASLRTGLLSALRVRQPGRYLFLLSATMSISTAVPPSEKTMETLQLISGTAEIEVPASLIYTNTTQHLTETKRMPPEAYFIDPTRGGTPEERAAIQRSNEAMTNQLRKRWPHLLGEAPLPTNSTKAAAPPLVSPPLAKTPVKERGGSRWWLAGVAVACVACIGFVILRRRHGGPPV